ncbi:M23 family metallopeptidase [Sphingomonas japonica]|uniref:Murein DD-endopeptidase MepM/ murein hydrolase activator NlpD n=1 Tax=Sphingomonas japonica TaxID=511662 RepID=A0ABX0U248_9SPHN|nr:M23 family metallopeptidase [Sphingomonas japonica]NIJ24644.1 murein DD-endopeptidase MepM/ murein hydrolase activator NlpD [Sphingomonas japonica]
MGSTGARIAAMGAAIGIASGLAGCIPGDRSPPPPAAPVASASPQRVDPVPALPAPRPAWQTGSIAADARSVAATTYSVERGDTLRGIAERFGAGSEAIARANALTPPFTIFPGQRLVIPGGRYHLVRAGQTGIAIARAYGVDWSRIVTDNALEEPYILRIGQRILIPGGEPGAAPVSYAERARAFELDIDDLVTGSEPAIADSQRPAAPSTSPKRVLSATTAVATPVRASKGGFQWPVDGRITDRFGPGRSGERNDGIKLAVPNGTPIAAAADGVVAYVGSDIPSLGGLVILKHGSNLTSVYGHASELLVQRGQAVKRGQRIALSGDSGSAERPELHFEIRQGRTPVDPLTRLPPR